MEMGGRAEDGSSGGEAFLSVRLSEAEKRGIYMLRWILERFMVLSV